MRLDKIKSYCIACYATPPSPQRKLFAPPRAATNQTPQHQVARTIRAWMPTYAQLLVDFKAFDFNGDGIISADEFLAILQRNGENADLDMRTAALMLNSIAKHDGGKHDKDGDGRISVDELADALADEPEEVEVPVLRQMCEIFKKELGIEKTLPLRDVVLAAAAQLGVPVESGSSLHDLSTRCWKKMRAEPGPRL